MFSCGLNVNRMTKQHSGLLRYCCRACVAWWRRGYCVVLDLMIGDRGFNPSHCIVNASCSHAFASITKQYSVQHKLGNKQTHCVTHWCRVHGLAASAGGWMRTTESEISACLWDKWLRKDFSLFEHSKSSSS